MKKAIKISTIVFVLLAAVILLSNSLYMVEKNHCALVKRFGRIEKIVTGDGLHIKIPFIENIQIVYSGNRVYDIPTSDVITKDKKSMIVDDYVIWKVVDPAKYYKTLGAVDARAEERIDAAVYNATKNTISSMTQDEVIAARGDHLTAIVTDASNSDMSEYGIDIITAEIKALDLPDDNKNAVYERMISERQNIAASYTAQGESDAQIIRNETDKEVAITLAEANKSAEQIIAEGEAEYMKILSEAYNDPAKADFYNYIRGLDALRESLKGNNNTLILDKDSELVKLLYGQEISTDPALLEQMAKEPEKTEATEQATTEEGTTEEAAKEETGGEAAEEKPAAEQAGTGEETE